MNATQLLAHFDRLAEAPGAVPRLRRFILDLAVRGKLVEQDAGDEPASALLKKIESEIARLVKIGEMRKPKALPPIEAQDEPFDAPTGWRWVRIRQVTSDRGQTTPAGEFTYIDVGSINKEAGVLGEHKVLSANDAPSRARKVIGKGDVLYSCVRPTLLNIAVVEDEITPTPIASTAFAVLNSFGLVLPRYLWIALRSPYLEAIVEAGMRGQAYPAINDAEFALLPLALPPLAEQHRIVAKVDELMALCDQFEAAQQERERHRDRLAAASLQRLNQPAADTTAEAQREHARFHLHHLPRLTTRPEHIKAMRQTISNFAVHGWLVPQSPEESSAMDALDASKSRSAKDLESVKKTSELRKARDTGKPHTQPMRLDVDGQFLLPSSWVWVNWECILASGSGSFKRGPFGSALTKAIFVKEGYKVYEQYCPINDDCSFARYYITPEKYEEMKGFAVKPRDFLISCSGVTLGRITQVPEAYEEGVINQALLRVRTERTLIDDDFFKKLFRSPYFQGKLFDNSTGTAIPNLKGVADLKAIPVPLPPLAEQHRIVAKVDELMALCDQLETQLTTTQTDSRRLLEAVLGQGHQQQSVAR